MKLLENLGKVSNLLVFQWFSATKHLPLNSRKLLFSSVINLPYFSQPQAQTLMVGALANPHFSLLTPSMPINSLLMSH